MHSYQYIYQCKNIQTYTLLHNTMHCFIWSHCQVVYNYTGWWRSAQSPLKAACFFYKAQSNRGCQSGFHGSEISPWWVRILIKTDTCQVLHMRTLAWGTKEPGLCFCTVRYHSTVHCIYWFSPHQNPGQNPVANNLVKNLVNIFEIPRIKDSILGVYRHVSTDSFKYRHVPT